MRTIKTGTIVDGKILIQKINIDEYNIHITQTERKNLSIAYDYMKKHNYTTVKVNRMIFNFDYDTGLLKLTSPDNHWRKFKFTDLQPKEKIQEQQTLSLF